MEKLKILLLVMFLSSWSWCIAQNQIIRGKISSEEGRPLDGATITLKGTKTATVANAEGSYSITVPSGPATLVFSSIGYLPVEQPVTGGTADVVLKKDDRRLSEVIVVGYGQTQKRTVSGSISRIGAR